MSETDMFCGGRMKGENKVSDKIKWMINNMEKTEDKRLGIMKTEEVEKARNFHKSFPGYTPTPLTELPKMAKKLEVGRLFVKDESYRFDLNAFKVLGGSYAIAKYIAAKLGCSVEKLSFEELTSHRIKEKIGQLIFFTATDGNHGRGVAWAANRLGQKAVVFMPKGTTKQRFENIRKENAEVTIEEVNYDECVRMAMEKAGKTKNGVVIQDTAWEGYEEIPGWIMQGYGTMAMEADEQFLEAVGTPPTHVFVQAGVGSLAGAVQGYFAQKYGENAPKVIIVEAREADCLFRSAKHGKICKVDGDMPTIMAGLACGEPNILSWDILRNHAAAFLSCKDSVAVLGMRMLAAPIKGDKPITSGESGAVPFGALVTIMVEQHYQKLKDELGLDKTSKILCFSTEGNTDSKRYENIVWKGKNE